MRHATWGFWYWPIFIWTVIGIFVPPETYAFFTNSNNTLSDFAWYELGIHGSYTPHSPTWWGSLVITVSAMAVLVAHIWFKTPS